VGTLGTLGTTILSPPPKFIMIQCTFDLVFILFFFSCYSADPLSLADECLVLEVNEIFSTHTRRKSFKEKPPCYLLNKKNLKAKEEL
jgi:hypothetical protein